MKPANRTLTEDAGFLSGSLDAGDGSTNGRLSSRIISRMPAIDSCPPGTVMMDNIDFARHGITLLPGADLLDRPNNRSGP